MSNITCGVVRRLLWQMRRADTCGTWCMLYTAPAVAMMNLRSQHHRLCAPASSGRHSQQLAAQALLQLREERASKVQAAERGVQRAAGFGEPPEGHEDAVL